jgi:hypothetical protein
MLLSWKVNRPLSIVDAVASLGPQWIDYLKKDNGLAAQTFTEEEFLKASSLRFKPPANYLSSVYVGLLASYGPLWINTGDGILNHATLLAGAQTRRDGRIDFRFVDPQTGQFVTKSDEVFFNEFENEARVIVTRGLKWEFRFQILYV